MLRLFKISIIYNVPHGFVDYLGSWITFAKKSSFSPRGAFLSCSSTLESTGGRTDLEEDQQRGTVKEKEFEECRGRRFDRNIKL
jgi:hypothetical protein